MTEASLSQTVREHFEARRFREAFTDGIEGLDEGQDVLSRGEGMRVQRWIGLSAVAMGRVQVAIPHLREAHEWDPLDYEVGLALGGLLLDDGRFDEGGEVLEAVLLHHRDGMPTDVLFDASLRLAESYLAAENPGAAIRRLEECRRIHPSDLKLDSLLGVAYERTGEFRKAVALHRVPYASEHDPAERADRALSLGRLLSGSQPDEAAELLENAAFELAEPLDQQPRRLALFEKQTELLEAAEAWASLHEAYISMIGRLDETSADLQSILALLWRKTGDVSASRLGLRERAANEYAKAEVHKNAADQGEPLYVPTGMYEEASPVEELWRKLSDSPADTELALDYAAALADRGDWQYAQNVLDVVAALGGGDAQTREAAAGRRRGVRDFRRPLTDDLRNRYLRPRSRRAALDALFHIAFFVLGPYIAQDSDELDLQERDRLTRGARLPVVGALRQTSANLGFPRPPVAYSHSGRGLRSAHMLDPVILIGADRLAASDNGALRFETGQLLTMLQPRFAFAGTMTSASLVAVAEALSGTRLISAVPPDPSLIERYRAFGRASIEERWVEPLKDVTRRLEESESPPSIDSWRQAVSAEAARTGLICAGDVTDALKLAATAPALHDEGDLSERSESLATFAMSPECYRLRGALGLLD